MHSLQFDPYDFKKKEIDGVPVYYKNLPWTPCINIYAVFNTGAFSDPAGLEGLSHFLEHMIFDGSPKLKDKKAIHEWSKKCALNSWNAWTGFYQTAYHLRCLPENYIKALGGMRDMIFHPYLRAKDIEHERGVITQEAWRRFKNEKFLAYTKEVASNLYHGHNFSRVSSALGWPETIAKISQQDVKKWHEEKYAKGNLSLFITGAIEEKHLELLKTFVKNLPKKSFDQYEKGIIGKPKKLKFIKTSDEIGDPNEQAEITIYRGVNYISAEKTQMVNLFRSLMGDILNERLRTEKGLCYSVMTSAWLFTDFSEIFMNLKTDEKNIDIVQKEFWKIMREINTGKHKAKFNVLKKVSLDQMRSREFMSDEVTSDVVTDVNKNNKITPFSEEISEMQKVTYGDVAKFTKETFDPKWTFTEIVLPSKK